MNLLGRTKGGRARERNLFATLHDHRRSIGLSYQRLAVVVILSIVTGLAQAAVLIILVRIATALTADTVSITGSIGPLTATDLTVAQLIWLGLVILVVLFVAEFATSWAQASLFANALRTAQRRMLAAYSSAGYDVQTELQRGETNRVLFDQAEQSAGLVNFLGAGVIALVNFMSLFASALVLSTVAAVVVLAGLVVLLVALRPLVIASRRIGGARATEQRRMSALSMERFELSREVKAFGVGDDIDLGLRRQIDVVVGLVRRLRILARMTSASYRIGAYAITLAMMALIDASNASNLAALTGSLLMLLRSLSYGQATQTMYQALNEGVPVVEQMTAEEARLIAGSEYSNEVQPIADVGEIVLRDVSLEYQANERVLHDVSLVINKGDFVAVVGPSGAGKSTLMYLLLRLRRPTGGDIEVDGIPIANIDLRSWRQRVAYVPQEPKLQSGTVADAIRFHRAGISDADVVRAAQLAHVGDEISSWPNGYLTLVGQLGEELSGGQRQRIALARALVGRPDLLLLDEPTSAIDPNSEKLIGESLEALRGEMTIVVIAHRFTTVQHANRVILVEGGRVVPHKKDDLSTLAAFMGVSPTED